MACGAISAHRLRTRSANLEAWGGYEMAARRIQSLALLVVGVLLVLLAVLADTIGVGRVPGFGWKQTLTLLVGLALMGVGWFVKR